MPSLYLKPNAIAEPLFNQWYAWSYLIPPASAALYVANSHLKILESFLEAPQLHQAALSDPAMRGGPFIPYDASRVPELQALFDRTRQEQADLLELGQAIHDLDQLLQQPKGYSLEPLYAQTPAPLRGYVELVYDTHHHASMRLLEGLLYRSAYYQTAFQSIALYLGNEDRRAFVLSTPRLKESHSLHLAIPFSDPRLDRLFQMRQIPGDYTEIRKMLDIEDDRVFASLFTDIPPKQQPHYTEDAVRVRYYGHACVLIETANVSVLCDPLISYQNQSGLSRYTYLDLPDAIDYALITHNHQDHVMLETLLQLRHKIRTVIVPKSNKGSLIDPSLKLILQAIGFTNVQEIDELETMPIPEGEITGLPAFGEHGDLNIGAKTAYLIRVKQRSILCAADSNNIEPQLYDHLATLLGTIDVIFIGMECDGAPYTWAYGSLLTQPISRKMAQTRRLDGSNADRAIQLIRRFNPQQVYVYAMGQEPWLTHITSIDYTDTSRPILESNQLIEYCRQRNIHSERLLGCKEIILDEAAGNRSPLAPLSPSDRLRQQKGGTQASFFDNPFIRNPQENQTKRSEVPFFKGDLGGSPPIQVWLANLAQQDIRFSIEQDGAEPRLKCNAPKGMLTAALQAQLKQRKAEIIQFLMMPPQPQIDLAAEAILDPAIQLAARSASHPPQRILLTGATGFLGAFLLNELLQQTHAEIYCLIRADNTASAQQKLQRCLISYGVWQELLQHRLMPIAGDLSQPLLGLSEAAFQTLAAQIDTIYHNGAWVNHTSPYSLLKATNVLGTQEVIRLACCHQVKPLHFISTISVFAANHQSGVQIVQESDPLDPSRVPSSGYAQSKWIAEKLVTIAQSRGLPISIYRPGAISGHSQTGVFNSNDFLYKLIQGCIQLGYVPAGEMQLNLLPVDYVSQAIVYLSQHSQYSQSNHSIFHLVHPQPVSSSVLFEVLRSNGYAVQPLPYDQWRTLLVEIAQTSPDHPLYSIMPLFSTSHAQLQVDRPVLEFDCQNTLNRLKNSSIVYPSINAQLFKVYFNYLLKQNLIQSPSVPQSIV
ncbi:MAG: NAD-dependent epimerase/dehydratase family protein [Cyanobacteria bacterium CRU_2_1]|nr:NAD-dependent epimerase/dehydratase family protein [Cyanobacteria bacterium CRU_2_1]